MAKDPHARKPPKPKRKKKDDPPPEPVTEPAPATPDADDSIAATVQSAEEKAAETVARERKPKVIRQCSSCAVDLVDNKCPKCSAVVENGKLVPASKGGYVGKAKGDKGKTEAGPGWFEALCDWLGIDFE